MCKCASVLLTGVSQSSSNKADKFTVSSTSLHHAPPHLPTEVCKEADPSHNGGAEDFIEVHMGDAFREITPPTLPMYTLCKGVAGTPQGPVYHL